MNFATDLTARSSRLLDDLVAELTDRFREGDSAAIDELLRDHPAHAERLRTLLPALALMDNLGAPSGSGRSELHPAHDPTGGLGVLGDFRIIREVGRGGMGVVYEATQISLGRRVALKVLPFAAAIDPQHLARFRVEAQAAALLHHPHIVPIHAVGCDRGVHYYAMQFIDGRTLAEVIAELRRGVASPEGTSLAPSTPVRRRDLARTAARLASQAAEALEHAHGLGVIHRDVKPANLLIDAAGNLWVADFGLARLANDAGTTRPDHLVGTLRYMTPEQALGRRASADGRADVYALGVTLYELLTLRPAFDGKDRRVVLRQVAFEEPRAPRVIDAAIPRDLETIVLKAMAKEPESRYATAGELADDLRQFLDDRPIRARRPTALGLLARWAKRHRAVVSTTILTLVLACSVSSILLWRENLRTREALRHAETARLREREAHDLTFAGSDLIATRALEKITSGSGKIEGADAEFCRRVLDHYERICARHSGDAAVTPLLAAAEHRVGFLRRILGLDGAEPHLVRAVALHEASVAARPFDPNARKALAAALEDLAATIEAGRGSLASGPARNRALEVRREIAALDPAVPEHRLSFALTLAYRIGPLLDQGDATSAEAARSELAGLTDESLGLAPTDAAHRNDLAWLLADRPGGSARVYHRAVELARRAVAIAPGDRGAWNTLGVALYRAGDDRAAVQAFEQSLRTRDGGDPYDWLFLALAHQRLGDRDRARALFDRSLAWIADRRPNHADLIRFRDEANAVFRD